MKSTESRHPLIIHLFHFGLIMIGAVIAAAGVEIFLVPDNLIDGGVVGISIMVSSLAGMPLGLLTAAFNIPFLYMGYKYIGKTFLLSCIFGITIFSVSLFFFHPIPGFTNDVLLAAVFGGVLVGIGVGIIIRSGGSLDGTEMVAIILSRKTTPTVGQYIIFFNLLIMGFAGLLFGWDRAMYSLLAYFIAYKVIDVVVEGIDESKAAMIVSSEWDEITRAIEARLGRNVTFLQGEGSHSRNETKVIYAVVTRIEIAKLKAIIMDVDGNAFVTIHNVYEVMSKRYNNKKSIH